MMASFSRKTVLTIFLGLSCWPGAAASGRAHEAQDRLLQAVSSTWNGPSASNPPNSAACQSCQNCLADYGSDPSKVSVCDIRCSPCSDQITINFDDAISVNDWQATYTSTTDKRTPGNGLFFHPTATSGPTLFGAIVPGAGPDGSRALRLDYKPGADGNIDNFIFPRLEVSSGDPDSRTNLGGRVGHNAYRLSYKFKSVPTTTTPSYLFNAEPYGFDRFSRLRIEADPTATPANSKLRTGLVVYTHDPADIVAAGFTLQQFIQAGSVAFYTIYMKDTSGNNVQLNYDTWYRFQLEIYHVQGEEWTTTFPLKNSTNGNVRGSDIVVAKVYDASNILLGSATGYSWESYFRYSSANVLTRNGEALATTGLAAVAADKWLYKPPALDTVQFNVRGYGGGAAAAQVAFVDDVYYETVNAKAPFI